MVDERRRLLPRGINHEDDFENPPCLCCFQRSESETRTWPKITVLIAVALERLAFYSISGNLILFLNGTNYLWSSADAMVASFFFLGISCLFYFIGGLIADMKCGRYRVICVGFFIYIIGYSLFPMFSYLEGEWNSNTTNFHCDSSDKENKCTGFIYPALTVVAIGTGVVRANIAPFGADQVKFLISVKQMSSINQIKQIWYNKQI